LALAESEAIGRVLLALLDLVAAQLPRPNRVHALDALGGVAVGDRAHLQRVHFCEIGHLIEGQRGIVDQPHGSCLRHQRCIAHGSSPGKSRLRFAHLFLEAKSLVIGDDGVASYISRPGPLAQWAWKSALTAAECGPKSYPELT